MQSLNFANTELNINIVGHQWQIDICNSCLFSFPLDHSCVCKKFCQILMDFSQFADCWFGNAVFLGLLSWKTLFWPQRGHSSIIINKSRAPCGSSTRLCIMCNKLSPFSFFWASFCVTYFLLLSPNLLVTFVELLCCFAKHIDRVGGPLHLSHRFNPRGWEKSKECIVDKEQAYGLHSCWRYLYLRHLFFFLKNSTQTHSILHSSCSSTSKHILTLWSHKR